MRTTLNVWCMIVAATSCMASGCGDDTSSTPDGGGGDGGGGDSGSTDAGESPADSGPRVDAGLCINTGVENDACPYEPPRGDIRGECAPRGECCHSSSNRAKIDQLAPDAPMVLEYVVARRNELNHPLSLFIPITTDPPPSRPLPLLGEQPLLFRFSQPRQDGAPIQGAGTVQIGVGRYNCDGTYSFYADDAAPVGSGAKSDPARWAALPAPALVDPAQDDVDRQTIAFSTAHNRKLSCSPVLYGGEVRHEICEQGFELLELPTGPAELDCIGSWDQAWSNAGSYESYWPLAENAEDVIDSLGITFCQTLSFGVLPPDKRDQSCLTTPRCLPGADCDWIKLPDSLCPVTDNERERWGCHLGARGNVNDEEGYPESLSCTIEQPAGVLDPARGSTTQGQCCDPLGQDTDGLPACNAFRVVTTFAAAAAEITDNPSSQLAPVCDE